MRVANFNICAPLTFTIVFLLPSSNAAKVHKTLPHESAEAAQHRLLSRHHGLPRLSPLLVRDSNFARGTLWSDLLQKSLLEAVRAEEEQEEESSHHGDNNSTATFSSDAPTRRRRNLQSGTDTDCSSPLFDWAYGHVRAMGFANYRAITDSAYNITMMPYVYKLYVDGSDDDEYFGNDKYGGRIYTEALIESHARNEEFWTYAAREGVDAEWEGYGGSTTRGDGRPSQPIDLALETDDVLLLGMHGSDLSDEGNLIETIRFMFAYGPDGCDGIDNDDDGDGALSDEEINAIAKDILTLIQSLPGGFDNPMLTLNAMASKSGFLTLQAAKKEGDSEFVDEWQQEKGGKKARIKKNNNNEMNRVEGEGQAHDVYVPDSLLIGDGILQFLDDVGLGRNDNGPVFVHSHEFGHLLQFQSDLTYLGRGTPASHETRRVELMADAYASYRLSHPSGGGEGSTTAEGAIRAAADVAFALGDCGSDNDWHHGTPDQRSCAAAWGYGMAKRGGGAVLHPEALRRRFDEALGDIVALNSSVCSLDVAVSGWDDDGANAVSVEKAVTVEEAQQTRPSTASLTNPPTFSLSQRPTATPAYLHTPATGKKNELIATQLPSGPSMSPITDITHITSFDSFISLSPSVIRQLTENPTIRMPRPTLQPRFNANTLMTEKPIAVFPDQMRTMVPAHSSASKFEADNVKSGADRKKVRRIRVPASNSVSAVAFHGVLTFILCL